MPIDPDLVDKVNIILSKKVSSQGTKLFVLHAFLWVLTLECTRVFNKHLTYKGGAI